MANDIIDTSLHVATFPSTYTGPGTLIGHPVNGGVDDHVHGYFTSTNNPVDIPCGFRPMEVEINNVTDGLIWKWQYGMPATDTNKITLTGPVVALDTNSGITVVAGDTWNSKYTVTISAAAAGNSKLILYKILG